MAAISNYVLFSEEYNGPNGDSFPLDYYVFQESLGISQTGVEDLPEVMDFFSEVFGPYPFANEKYGMTQLGFYGAIENQTNTIQNNLSSSWFYTTVHELGHMWFGDMITLSNWHHSWLNEGFATYSEALWDEHLYGFSGYKAHMVGNEFWNGGTLYLENASDTFNTFQSIFYSKGAYAVHMLRGVLGDDAFFDALLDYAQDPDFMYKNASTEDMQESFENSSGIDLDFFIEQWVYDEYWPYYYYNFGQNSNNDVSLVIHQAQEELYGYRPVFEMPIQVKFNYANGGDTIVKIWNDEQTQQFSIYLVEEISTVVIDPDKWILRKTQFDPGISVSFEDHKSNQDIRIYPNPFHENLIIDLSGLNDKGQSITIYNASGQLISTIPIRNDRLIWNGTDLSGKQVEDGIYFLELKTEVETFSKRVILKR